MTQTNHKESQNGTILPRYELDQLVDAYNKSSRDDMILNAGTKYPLTLHEKVRELKTCRGTIWLTVERHLGHGGEREEILFPGTRTDLVNTFGYTKEELDHFDKLRTAQFPEYGHSNTIQVMDTEEGQVLVRKVGSTYSVLDKQFNEVGRIKPSDEKGSKHSQITLAEEADKENVFLQPRF